MNLRQFLRIIRQKGFTELCGCLFCRKTFQMHFKNEKGTGDAVKKLITIKIIIDLSPKLLKAAIKLFS
jgi:hypothetical protein